MAYLDDEDYQRLAELFAPVASAAAVDAAEGLTAESMHRALVKWGANGGGTLIRQLVAEEVAPIRAAVLGDPESLAPQPGLVQTIMDMRQEQAEHAGKVAQVASALAAREKREDRRHKVVLSVITAGTLLGVPTLTYLLPRLFGA